MSESNGLFVQADTDTPAPREEKSYPWVKAVVTGTYATAAEYAMTAAIKSGDDLSKTDRAVLILAGAHMDSAPDSDAYAGITPTIVANVFGLAESSVKQTLDRIVRVGVLAHDGRKSGGQKLYQIPETVDLESQD